jgi:hypothetical protein
LYFYQNPADYALLSYEHKVQLAKDEIGIITVLDFSSYVAVKRSKVKTSRDFGGLPSEKFVRDTTEISSSVVITGNINSSKTTTIFIGFDEDIASQFTNVDGEFDVETTIESDTQNYEDDIDVNTTFIAVASATTSSIYSRPREIIGNVIDKFGSIDSNIKDLSEYDIKNIYKYLKKVAYIFYNKKLGIKYGILKENDKVIKMYNNNDNGFLIYMQKYAPTGESIISKKMGERTIHFIKTD